MPHFRPVLLDRYPCRNAPTTILVLRNCAVVLAGLGPVALLEALPDEVEEISVTCGSAARVTVYFGVGCGAKRSRV